MRIIPENPACFPVECDIPAYVGLNAQGETLCPVRNLMWRDNTSRELSDVLGCKSECALYNQPQFCCGPGAEGAKLCVGSNPWFKTACPHVYTYASDDAAGVHTCHTTGFKIIFTCPS